MKGGTFWYSVDVAATSASNAVSTTGHLVEHNHLPAFQRSLVKIFGRYKARKACDINLQVRAEGSTHLSQDLDQELHDLEPIAVPLLLLAGGSNLQPGDRKMRADVTCFCKTLQ